MAFHIKPSEPRCKSSRPTEVSYLLQVEDRIFLPARDRMCS